MKAVSYILISCCLMLCQISLAQKIGVFNESGKLIYKIKQGKGMDIRIDYSLLYPEISDSTLEARIYGIVDSISGKDVYLIENQLITKYTASRSIILEEDYEYTNLKINLGDVKEISFTRTAASIGDALLTIGIAAIIVSPLVGLTPDGYSTSRVLNAAMVGAGLAVAGGGLSLAFGQKPVIIREFDGPQYFKKSQKGSISLLEQ